MWLTRILHVLIFNLCLQISIAHLNALPNTGLNNPIISSALHNNGLIIPKNLNQIPKPQKSLNIQQINKIQKPVNLQQPIIQQSPNLQPIGNLQQSRNLQQIGNLQQAPNLQQIGNIQQSPNLQPIGNLQQASNLQQIGNVQQAPNLQQIGNLQQGPNLQQIGNLQQSPNLQPIGNFQQTPNLQQIEKLQQGPNLQQIGNLQQSPKLQQIGNFQQSPNLQQIGNLQQAPNLQQIGNLQQVPNLQQIGNLQQSPHLPPNGNLPQAPNLQETGNFQQAVNLQQGKKLQQLNIQQSGFHPNSFQQQNVIPKMNNLQFPNQQPRAFQTSSPILNSNLVGINNPLPDKPLTSGINSNQGIQSHLNQGSFPTASNFNFHPNVGMKYTGFIQNGQIPSTDIALNINQASPNQFPTIPETSINNQPSLTVLTQPGQDPNIIQNLPMDYQKQIAIIKSVQPQHSLDRIQNQLPAINLNQIPTLPPTMPEPLNYAPLATGYSADSLLNTIIAKKSSKSPNLKALLPLIFNLLKEKNSGCGCHCGCVNDNMPDPQIFSGYAKQNNYGSHYDEIPPMEDDSNEDFDTNRSKNKSSQEKDNDNGEETDSREIDEDCNATCEDNED